MSPLGAGQGTGTLQQRGLTCQAPSWRGDFSLLTGSCTAGSDAEMGSISPLHLILHWEIQGAWLGTQSLALRQVQGELAPHQENKTQVGPRR